MPHPHRAHTFERTLAVHPLGHWIWPAVRDAGVPPDRRRLPGGHFGFLRPEWQQYGMERNPGSSRRPGPLRQRHHRGSRASRPGGPAQARRNGSASGPTLMDCWVLDRAQIRELIASGIPVAHWLPVDVDRPRRPDSKPDGRPRGLGKWMRPSSAKREQRPWPCPSSAGASL